MSSLFDGDLHIINAGVQTFHDAVVASGGDSQQIDWAPPGNGDVDLAVDLAQLVGDERVSEANRVAHGRYLASQPRLVDLRPASEAIPGFGGKRLLHAGPPIAWESMCGPMQGAIVGAIMFEGWASDEAAARLAAAGTDIKFSPCHDYAAVGPMAGVISPSMDVWVVRDAATGEQSYSNLNEGLGKVLRFGANSSEVIDRLRWMRDVLAPGLRSALQVEGEVELKPIMAQALHMGDEVHNRNAAASAIFLKRLLRGLLECGLPTDSLQSIVAFVNGNDHFFLNVSMAACKAMLDAAHGVENSSMVTAMCRNGVEFGVRVSGTGQHWFTSQAPVVDGLFFPGYGKEDAAPDLGDSAITETSGLGGFAMAAALAIVQFVGGSPADAIGYTREMISITIGRNGAFSLPQLDFTGTPSGIDAVTVVDTRTSPIINTGIAHRDAGIGQVGAGIVRAPMECFSAAVRRLAELVRDGSPE